MGLIVTPVIVLIVMCVSVQSWEPVDAVNTSQESVDETAKGEQKVCYEIPDWKPGMVFPAPKREWVGLTVNEARKFYEKYTDREELIYAIDEFLEEKNA
jgi:hypothetical protein